MSATESLVIAVAAVLLIMAAIYLLRPRRANTSDDHQPEPNCTTELYSSGWRRRC